MMDEILVEVISEKLGSKEHIEIVNMVKDVISELRLGNVRILEEEVFDENVTLKYGVIPAPSIAINGVLMVIGRRPSRNEIKDLILRTTIAKL
ncbi:MAG: hypothetical protein B6U75_04890 [Desulfurococcales archaeon ex4484_217_1]|nr:MAG: hypothetical protein B6U75_04890 [Desulfurococcales archaeon ex4484_217_1]